MIYSLNYDIFTGMTVGAWGCDRSVEDAYSSMASDPISDYCNSPNLLCAYLIFFFWNFFGHCLFTPHSIIKVASPVSVKKIIFIIMIYFRKAHVLLTIVS